MNTAATADAALWFSAAAILVLLCLSAFFSGSETALTAASRAKLKTLADRGDRGARTAIQVTEDGERMIGAFLLGNNVVNILSASLATALLVRLFGDAGVALATLGMTLLVLIFGEVLPKTLAITNPEPFAARVAPVIRVLILVFSPVVMLVRRLVRAILRAAGVRSNPDAHITAMRDEIAGAIALGHSEGAMHRDDRDRLLGVFDLQDRTVEEVMRHRRDIEMIDADRPASEIIAQVLGSPHTRLPLYRDSDENILGVLHAKDLLREVARLRREEGPDALDRLDVLKVAMKPYFVPETTSLDDQMRAFLSRRTHFALVVDEYGGLQGLVTLEDIIEEIIGDIRDEFDAANREAAPRPTETGDFVIDGAMTIRDLNRMMDWQLPDDEANTVAGLVIHEAQTIPAEGQCFSFHGFRFEVAQRKENRLTRIKVRPLDPPA